MGEVRGWRKEGSYFLLDLIIDKKKPGCDSMSVCIIRERDGCLSNVVEIIRRRLIDNKTSGSELFFLLA